MNANATISMQTVCSNCGEEKLDVEIPFGKITIEWWCDLLLANGWENMGYTYGKSTWDECPKCIKKQAPSIMDEMRPWRPCTAKGA